MDDAQIRKTDWLGHRWPFEITHRFMCGVTRHIVCVGGLELSSHDTSDLAREWINRTRPVSLTKAVSDNPEFRGGLALVEAGGKGRLARLPARLWPSYDAIVVTRTPRCLGILSAKARAMYSGEFAVFIRVYSVINRA
ncbi:MAG: hypothetical protein V4808_07015 [Pseudomonadota bacterium]